MHKALKKESGEGIMDIKEKISEVVEKIMKDDDLREQFQKEPVKAVEKVIGVDLQKKRISLTMRL